MNEFSFSPPNDKRVRRSGSSCPEHPFSPSSQAETDAPSAPAFETRPQIAIIPRMAGLHHTSSDACAASLDAAYIRSPAPAPLISKSAPPFRFLSFVGGAQKTEGGSLILTSRIRGRLSREEVPAGYNCVLEHTAMR